MVVPNTTMDLHEHISKAIRQNNIMKLFFQKSFIYYLCIIFLFDKYIIYYFSLYLLLSVVCRNNLLVYNKVE